MFVELDGETKLFLLCKSMNRNIYNQLLCICLVHITVLHNTSPHLYGGDVSQHNARV